MPREIKHIKSDFIEGDFSHLKTKNTIQGKLKIKGKSSYSKLEIYFPSDLSKDEVINLLKNKI